MKLSISIPLLCFAMFAPNSSVSAQANRADEVKVQKTAAEENLKKAELKKIAPVESADILLYTTLPEAKAKLIAAGAQKAFDATQKVLKFSDMEKLWPGKLTVYLIPERKDYTAFIRLVEQRKPDGKDLVSVKVRGPEPYIAMGVEQGIKQTDADLIADLGEGVAEAMLSHRAGVNPGVSDLPGWLKEGFSKAMILRVPGNDAKLTAHRAKVKGMFAKAKLPTFKAMDVWSGAASKDSETLMISLVEYFVYGLEAGKFDKLLVGFKPDEQGRAPSVDTALLILDLKPDTLDTAWKAWVGKQK